MREKRKKIFFPKDDLMSRLMSVLARVRFELQSVKWRGRIPRRIHGDARNDQKIGSLEARIVCQRWAYCRLESKAMEALGNDARFLRLMMAGVEMEQSAGTEFLNLLDRKMESKGQRQRVRGSSDPTLSSLVPLSYSETAWVWRGLGSWGSRV